MPAIDDEMRAAYYRKREGVLRNEQKRYQVDEAVHERRQRALGLLGGHPLALQQVIANCVGYELIDGKHEDLAVLVIDGNPDAAGNPIPPGSLQLIDE